MVRRSFVVLVVCVMGVGFIAWATASRQQAQGIPSLPEQLGAWQGVDQPVEERTKALLGTDQVLMREYVNAGGDKIWLAVVYAADNRSAFHPPELCYTGSNFEILNRGTVDVARGDTSRMMTVNRLLMTNGQHQLLAFYWLTAGDEAFSSWHKQQVRLLWNQIRRQSSGGMLIRMSTLVESDGAGEQRAEQRLRDMASLIMREVGAELRRTAS